MRIRPHHKIVIMYFAFGCAWILVSDALVESLNSPVLEAKIQSYKGLIFVCLSSGLLYLLGKRASIQLEKAEHDKLGVFRSTVAGAYHILGNFLNQMQVLTLAADDCPEFDESAKVMARNATEDAKAALATLADVGELSEGAINSAIRRGTPSPFSRPPISDKK